MCPSLGLFLFLNIFLLFVIFLEYFCYLLCITNAFQNDYKIFRLYLHHIYHTYYVSKRNGNVHTVKFNTDFNVSIVLKINSFSFLLFLSFAYVLYCRQGFLSIPLAVFLYQIKFSFVPTPYLSYLNYKKLRVIKK